MVISDFFHLRLGAFVGGDQQHVYSVCSSRPAFSTGPSVCLVSRARRPDWWLWLVKVKDVW